MGTSERCEQEKLGWNEEKGKEMQNGCGLPALALSKLEYLKHSGYFLQVTLTSLCLYCGESFPRCPLQGAFTEGFNSMHGYFCQSHSEWKRRLFSFQHHLHLVKKYGACRTVTSSCCQNAQCDDDSYPPGTPCHVNCAAKGSKSAFAPCGIQALAAMGTDGREVWVRLGAFAVCRAAVATASDLKCSVPQECRTSSLHSLKSLPCTSRCPSCWHRKLMALSHLTAVKQVEKAASAKPKAHSCCHLLNFIV